MAAIAAIVAAQAGQKRSSFVDEFAGRSTTKDKLTIVNLTKRFGYAWRDFGQRNFKQVRERRVRHQARGGYHDRWTTESSEDRPLSQESESHSGPLSEQAAKEDKEDEPPPQFGQQTGQTVQAAPKTEKMETGGELAPTMQTIGIMPNGPEPDCKKHPGAAEIKRQFPALAGVSDDLLDSLELAREEEEASLGDHGTDNTCREKLWELMDDPDSGPWAFRIAALVLVTIMISCLAILVESSPKLYNDNDTADDVFFGVETPCVAIFTLEFILRISSCPNILQFCVQPMNVIDLLAILPYYIALIAPGINVGFLTVLRMLRMVRVLRFAQKDPSVACVMRTITKSQDIAVFMIFMLAIVVIVFASFEYNLERGSWDESKDCYVKDGEDSCSLYVSIPESMWWCMVTVMMVGYGDIFPTTILGKIVASLACVVGIMTVALPVSVLGANFGTEMDKIREGELAKVVVTKAREKGAAGVIESREKLTKCFQRYNDVAGTCIQNAKGLIDECFLEHNDLWRAHLRRIGDDIVAPAATVTVGHSRTVLYHKTTDDKRSGKVARPQDVELFNMLSANLHATLEHPISKTLEPVTRAAELCRGVTASLQYVQAICHDRNISFEADPSSMTSEHLESLQNLGKQILSKSKDPEHVPTLEDALRKIPDTPRPEP